MYLSRTFYSPYIHSTKFSKKLEETFLCCARCTYTSRNKFRCRVSAFTAAFTVRGRAQQLQKRFTKCGFTDAGPPNVPRDASATIIRGFYRHDIIRTVFLLHTMRHVFRRNVSFMSAQSRA